MAIALFELVNVEVLAGKDVTRRAEQLDEGGTDFGMCQRVRHLNGSFYGNSVWIQSIGVSQNFFLHS